MLICGSFILVGCGSTKYNKRGNVKYYNYMKYYSTTNVDVKGDILRLLRINSQSDIDTYTADSEYICRDLRKYLETKKFYKSIDVTIDSVSVDTSVFDNIGREYKDFKNIKYVVNARVYTDMDIFDCLVYATYQDNKIVNFEYIGG